jgi:hypothetical protein
MLETFGRNFEGFTWLASWFTELTVWKMACLGLSTSSIEGVKVSSLLDLAFYFMASRVTTRYAA